MRAFAEDGVDDRTELGAGLVLGERYRVERPLDIGVARSTFEATDLRTSATVHLELHPTPIDTEARARFEWSAKAAARLRHPSTARVLDFGDAPSGAFVVLEAVAGEPLDRWVERTSPSAEEALAVLDRILASFAEAHDVGVAVGGLEPANVLVDGDTVKVIGFVRGAAGSEVTGTADGAWLAAAGYGSPQWLRAGVATASDDVFSIGAMAFLLLTGEPFDPRRSLADIAGGQGPAPDWTGHRGAAPLRAVIDAALDPDPLVRPEDATELRARLVGPASRRRGPWIAAAVAALAIAAGVALTARSVFESRVAAPRAHAAVPALAVPEAAPPATAESLDPVAESPRPSAEARRAPAAPGLIHEYDPFEQWRLDHPGER